MNIGIPNEQERKAKQQERLVNRDFPWLWAVRNNWFFGGRDEIRVSNFEYDTSDHLNARPTANVETWIVSVWMGRFRVLKIEPTIPVGSLCWAESIQYSIGWQERIIYMVTITSSPDGLRRFLIHRPDKKTGDFIKQVLDTARFHREKT